MPMSYANNNKLSIDQILQQQTLQMMAQGYDPHTAAAYAAAYVGSFPPQPPQPQSHLGPPSMQHAGAPPPVQHHHPLPPPAFPGAHPYLPGNFLSLPTGPNGPIIDNLDFENPNNLAKTRRFKTRLCIYWMKNGNCVQGDTCSFAHGEHELPASWKTQLCRNFEEKGTCLRGENCGFAHGEHELRQSPKGGGTSTRNNNNRSNNNNHTNNNHNNSHNSPSNHTNTNHNNQRSPGGGLGGGLVGGPGVVENGEFPNDGLDFGMGTPIFSPLVPEQ